MDEQVLESFIQSCDDMKIATEGYNMNIASEINNPQLKRIRENIKIAKSLAKHGEYDNAINLYKKCITDIISFKSYIDSLDEPDTKLKRFLSCITPIFTLLPTSRVDNVIYTGNGYSISTTTIHDRYSDNTKSDVKSRIQLKMNTLIDNISTRIKALEKKKKKLKNK